MFLLIKLARSEKHHRLLYKAKKDTVEQPLLAKHLNGSYVDEVSDRPELSRVYNDSGVNWDTENLHKTAKPT